MNEAKKTNKLRGGEFISRYLSGKILDIGAGKDLVCPWAERFDIEDGDANFVSQYREVASYDAVHSSHCLEHMVDARATLDEWWSLIKADGFLVLVVPDEDLYEQGIWPSAFNPDHKWTFRLDKKSSWSPVSFDIRELVSGLPNCAILDAAVQDYKYDYSLQLTHSARRRKRGFLLIFLERVINRVPIVRRRLNRLVEDFAFHFGFPVDQTAREALAQIQVVARKSRP